MYRTILITVDMAHPEQMPELIRAAIRVADETSPVVFHLLYVDETFVHHGLYTHYDKTEQKLARKDIKRKLKDQAIQLLPNEAEIKCHIREGTVHEHILEESRQLKSDVILMMARRPGLASYFVGSNAERVVRHAKCTVMVLRGSY
jgi:nucleotide-binding universal stress UspA family protein